MHTDDRLLKLFDQLSDRLLAAMASSWFRPRIGQPRQELIEKIIAAYHNPPALDRVFKSLPASSRQLLALLGRSWQSRWTVGDLFTLLSALGGAAGTDRIADLFACGLLLPWGESADAPITSFLDWFAQRGTAAELLLPAGVRQRALSLPLRLDFAAAIEHASAVPPCTDGLDWPLRLAVVRQLVAESPVKLTTAGAVYKRDHLRFTADAVINAPLTLGPAPPDAGLLALEWAWRAGLLVENGELHAAAWPAWWREANPREFAGSLLGAFLAVRGWNPVDGAGEQVQTTGTVTLLLLNLLAQPPKAWVPLPELAAWMWEHHPHWAASLTPPQRATGGCDWLRALVQTVLAPCGYVETVETETGTLCRLSQLGCVVCGLDGVLAERVDYPQTILVQPNAQIVAYRQGLSPEVIADLTEFASWKGLGPACMLELSASSVMRGLERGQTLSNMVLCLERLAAKPVPANIHDLLQRWASRRERMTVYTGATLVEFITAADADAALARGIIEIRLTDRVGLKADGQPPDFSQLRLIGNRDYEAKPSTCVLAEDDGVTLRVDAAAADLLLDAEITRFAEPCKDADPTARRYRMTPASLQAVARAGMSLEQLDDWFLARSGEPLPPAARLFILPSNGPAGVASKMTVVQTATVQIADGILQWPETAPFIRQRLGPQALVVAAEHLQVLQERLAGIGIRIEESR